MHITVVLGSAGALQAEEAPAGSPEAAGDEAEAEKPAEPEGAGEEAEKPAEEKKTDEA